MKFVVMVFSVFLSSCETFHGVWGNSDEFENFKGIECIENVLESSPEVLSVERQEYFPQGREAHTKPMAFKLIYSLKGAPEPDAEVFLNKATSGKWQLRNSFGRLNIQMGPAKKEYAFKVIGELNDSMNSKCGIVASSNLKKTGS